MAETTLPLRPTALTVDLDAVAQNASVLSRHSSGHPILAVVKANAYGMGAVPVTKALEEAGVQWFGVALVEEGVQLRRAGVRSRILMLGPPAPGQAGACIDYEIVPAIYNLTMLEALEAEASRRNLRAQAHLKVDSGMGRLGFRPEEMPPLISALGRSPHVEISGLYSNLASADDPPNPQTARQLATFLDMLESLRAAGVDPSAVHLANSSGLLAHPTTHLTLCRPGLTLYGLRPSKALPDPGLRTAVGFHTHVTQVKDLPPGTPVGYSSTYVTPSRQRVGILPLGYADGLPRYLGGGRGHVLIHGARCPILGRVSMDLTAVDLEPAGQVAEGEKVTLWGTDGGEHLNPCDWGRWSETIPYEIMIGISCRVARRYLEAGRSWTEEPLAHFPTGDSRWNQQK